MNFSFIKKAPKIFLVAFLLIGTTVLFWFWWQGRQAAKNHPSGTAPVAVENRAPVDFAASLGTYFMADDDLYDAVAGQLVAKNFIEGTLPQRVAYEPQSKKFIGVFQNGLMRYSLAGKKEAELFPPGTPALTPESKTLIYAKNGDVWSADVDLVAFKFLNEHKVTSIGQFDDPHFGENILLLTDKYALWGIFNRHARIDLATGAVKPMQVQIPVNAKTRSPDSQVVVGVAAGNFVSYNFDEDRGNTIPLRRASHTDAQWLDNNRCLLLISHTGVGLYDRRTDKLEELCTLPKPCNFLAEPSPGSRYVFCGGQNGAGLIDVEQKAVVPLGIDARNCVWLDGDTMLCSWEGMDTDRRGTWIKKVGGEQKRICDEPFLAANNLAPVLVLKDAGLAVFQTKKGLQKIRLDGSGLQSFVGSPMNVGRLSIIGRVP